MSSLSMIGFATSDTDVDRNVEPLNGNITSNYIGGEPTGSEQLIVRYMEKLMQENKNRLDKIITENESRMKKKDRAHKEDIERIFQSHEERIKNLNDEHKSRIEKKDQEHKEEIERIVRAHEEYIKNLNDEHKEEVQLLTNRLKRVQDEFYDKGSVLRRQINELESRSEKENMSKEEIFKELKKLADGFPGSIDSRRELEGILSKAGVKKEDVVKAIERITKGKSPKFDWLKFVMIAVGGAAIGGLIGFGIAAALSLCVAGSCVVGGVTGAVGGASVGYVLC